MKFVPYPFIYLKPAWKRSRYLPPSFRRSLLVWAIMRSTPPPPDKKEFKSLCDFKLWFLTRVSSPAFFLSNKHLLLCSRAIQSGYTRLQLMVVPNFPQGYGYSALLLVYECERVRVNISTLRGKYWPKVSMRAEWTAVNQELWLFIRSILSNRTMTFSMRREEFGRSYDYKVDVSDRACIYLQMKGFMVTLWIPSRSRCCALFFISLWRWDL